MLIICGFDRVFPCQQFADCLLGILRRLYLEKLCQNIVSFIGEQNYIRGTTCSMYCLVVVYETIFIFWSLWICNKITYPKIPLAYSVELVIMLQ